MSQQKELVAFAAEAPVQSVSTNADKAPAVLILSHRLTYGRAYVDSYVHILHRGC